jgi:hypothetical protein
MMDEKHRQKHVELTRNNKLTYIVASRSIQKLKDQDI